MPNLARIIKDTGNNMYCVVDSLRMTFGFVKQSDLQGHKHVAALGKFIVETSQLTKDYANSIICYKFKSIGELDEYDQILSEDLYGYIVILNGTICPMHGEYVANAELVKHSLIQCAIAHPIDALYLASDVAEKFLGIFERLNHAATNHEMLLQIINWETATKLQLLREFIMRQLNSDTRYAVFISKLNQRISQEDQHDVFTMSDMGTISSIIDSLEFIEMLKTITVADNNKNLRYLIANIIQIPYTSDQLYWSSPHFKDNVIAAYLRPVSNLTSRKYKLALLIFVLTVCVFIVYHLKHKKPVQLPLLQPPVLKPVSVAASALIAHCIAPNDRFFRDIHPWTLTHLQCNSLGYHLTFVSDTTTNINQLIALVGESHNVVLNGKTGMVSKHYNIRQLHEQVAAIKSISAESSVHKKINPKLIVRQSLDSRLQIISNLQSLAESYGYQLTLNHALKSSSKGAAIHFTLQSILSPSYLQQHNVLSGVLLDSIDMTFNPGTGFYTWKITGVIV